MIEVDVACDEGLEHHEDAVAHDARVMLEALQLDAPELSILLTDDETIAGLNAQWRGKDEATDVLSFPQQDGEVRGGLLGDLVVSVPTAQRQAEGLGHDLTSELRVLMAHGLCHLLGHDHQGPDDTARMVAAERVLLDALKTPGLAGLVERAGSVR